MWRAGPPGRRAHPLIPGDDNASPRREGVWVAVRTMRVERGRRRPRFVDFDLLLAEEE